MHDCKKKKVFNPNTKQARKRKDTWTRSTIKRRIKIIIGGETCPRRQERKATNLMFWPRLPDVLPLHPIVIAYALILFHKFIRHSIISRLNPDKHLFQEALEETRNLAAHTHLAPFIPSIQLLESFFDLRHQPLHPIMTILSLPSSLHKALWVA